MRIEDFDKNRAELGSVGLGLTMTELRELGDAVRTLLDEPSNNHVHVSSADYQTEVTLWVVDESGEMLL